MHVPEGGEGGYENGEEQRRRAASRQMGQPALAGRSQGFPHLILPSLQGMQVRAKETNLIHHEKEGKKEADMFAGKEVWIRAGLASLSTAATAADSLKWVAVR